MIHIGKPNRLTVVAEFPFGFHLSCPESEDTYVTLPSHIAPKGLKCGDELDVFVGTDESGALVASLRQPLLQVGQTAVLKAAGATAFGAFFDWGLEKDLLVPSEYQESPVNPGMRYVVHAFYDNDSKRILGATRLHYFLKEQAEELSPGDTVECLVYAKTELGLKVVIDGRYLGLIFHSDAFKPLKVGDATSAVIKHIRPDGKIDVALQRTDKTGRSSLEQAIIEDLQAHGGLSTLTDKSAPDEIYQRFNVSKGAYKKALGALFKQRRILIDKQTIRLLDSDS
ncbi:hypothetical protein DXV75_05040 [Alteromonas aestuariivivens]|uniref:GntR family transcriptional regulator n=1 Tax=Alteromonas aestuariivivens TaxID=1938339 RepID=A0A3D8MBN3_9ALTE|nr:S1-like domain-containing RNA-binding protein [Alteromonas aestuariivivens]RDV27399.1 hypothetical protein DXV75_05040 [Alteromonas aestuariivivens]